MDKKSEQISEEARHTEGKTAYEKDVQHHTPLGN